jgi:hypothetical protein
MFTRKIKNKLIYYRDDYPFPLLEKEYSFPVKENPRIALVKQEVYADLYSCPRNTESKSVVLTSLLRSGFIGLFTKCKTDFIIVKLDPAPECQIWKEFSADRSTQQKLLNLTDQLPEVNIFPHSVPQGAYAVNVDEVDWSHYDIVISLNISVPKRVTEKFPQTVWAYCIGEPYMDTYQKSSEKPVEGYDLFLNQKFRRRDIGNKFHEIDFPYYLQYYGCFNDLLNIAEDNEERKGVIIEKHSFRLMKDKEIQQFEQLGPIYFQEGNTEQMLRTVLKAKYYYRLGGPKRWGNAMIEAAAGGCLFLGNKEEFVNKSLFSPFTHINSRFEFFKKVEILENMPKKYMDELSFIKNSVNNFCFKRPINNLYQRSEKIKIIRKNRKHNSFQV